MIKKFMKIKATDPLFFRTGKPFNMGEDSWTDSSLLPNPSVIWGAIFSSMMAQNKELRERVLNKKDINPEDYLSIKTIYLYNEETNTVLLPAPLDLFIDEKGDVVCERYIDKFNNNENEEENEIISSFNMDQYIVPDTEKDAERVKNCFITIDSLINYQQKKEEQIQLYFFDDIFKSDSKIGIKRDSIKKSSADNHLYRIDLTQFKEDWSFLIDIEYDNSLIFNKKGILKLGGEGKVGYYDLLEYNFICSIENTMNYIKEEIDNSENMVFKIILTSHSLFESIWKPNLNIIASSVGKSISIGGYDIISNSPKSMKKYVPAGSVYLIERIELNEIAKAIGSNKNGFNQFIILPI